MPTQQGNHVSDYNDTDFVGRTTPLPTLKLPGHRYRVIRKLGSGSMGEVHLAEDTKLHRRVAIKSIRADRSSGQILRRIKRECMLHARIGAHPHIVTLFDLHDEGDRLHLVMEYVDGDTLDHIISAHAKRGKLFPIADAVDIAIQCLRGLAHVHARGVIHRDIKPANVMITQDGTGRYTAKIMDFGVARQEEQDPELTTLTHPGSRSPGTPLYMAPEQIDSSKYGPVTPASDLYAVGVLLYQLIAGRTPFTGSLTDVFNGHLNLEPGEIRRPSGTVPNPLLADAIDRALEKHAHLRFASAAEFADELESIRNSVNAGGTANDDSEEEDSVLAAAWHGSFTRWALFGLAGIAIAGVALVGIPNAPLQMALDMLDGIRPVASPQASSTPPVAIPVDEATEDVVEPEQEIDSESEPFPTASKPAEPAAPKPVNEKPVTPVKTPSPAVSVSKPVQTQKSAVVTPLPEAQAPKAVVETPIAAPAPSAPVAERPVPTPAAEITPPTPAPTPEIIPPTATPAPAEVIPPTPAPESTPSAQDAAMAAVPTTGLAPTVPGLESIQIDNSMPTTPPSQPVTGTGIQLEVAEVPMVVEANDVDIPSATPVPVVEEEVNLEPIVVAKADVPAPSPEENEPVANIDRTYNVRSGDTLEIIARRFHLNVDDLVRWNQLSMPVTLRPDQRLYLYERPNLAAPAEPSSALDMGKQESRSKELLRKTKERVKEWIE
jgi:serine/threonine-protein kinase